MSLGRLTKTLPQHYCLCRVVISVHWSHFFHMSWWERLIERRILQANAKGQLKGLEGEGEPLPDRTGNAHTDPGLAAGYRIMAENGVLPEEFRIKKQVAEAKTQLAASNGAEDRKAAMARLADLEMRLAIAQEARKRFHQT